MSKLKVVERKIITKETLIELPAFFSFQKDDGYEEYVMIKEGGYISVEFSYASVMITAGRDYNIMEHQVSRCRTTMEVFIETYNEALKKIEL